MVSSIPISICRPRRRRCHQDPVRIRRRKRHVGRHADVRARATSRTRAKKKRIHMKDTHTDKGKSGKPHSLERRTASYSRQLCTKWRNTQNHSHISNRALHLIKKIARGAVKRESPDGPDSVQRENVMDLHGSKQRSRVFAVVEEDVCMCTEKTAQRDTYIAVHQRHVQFQVSPSSDDASEVRFRPRRVPARTC